MRDHRQVRQHTARQRWRPARPQRAVPSSIHAGDGGQTAGVFQVELRITRSMAGSQASGAAMKPTRRPAATLLDRPDT